MICADVAELSAALPREGALMGLDLGTETVGLALSDVRRRVATPIETLGGVKFGADATAILALASDGARWGLCWACR